MTPLIIKPENCTGCGRCIVSCAFGALSMVDGIATVEPELCCLCGACIKACPFSAIDMTELQVEPVAGQEHYKDIWVFAEQKNGVLHGSAFELLNVGRELAEARSCKLHAVVLGCEIDRCAVPLIEAGADSVYLVVNPLLNFYESSLYSDALTQLIEKYKPEVVLAAATSIGRGFFARTAVKVHAGLTADCTALAIDTHNGNLIQTRPAFGGNIMARIITPDHRPQMATVRPHVFKRRDPDTGRQGNIVHEEVVLSNPLTRIIDSIRQEGGVDLAEADIIIAGGRGLKKSGNFDLLFSLAEKVGGVVGASRACVDAGWISSSHQIGQTGKTVCPKVYIAFGISGAVQHLEGMRSSETIIAVNSDPHAPIFDVADVAVIGDLFEILPGLIQAL